MLGRGFRQPPFSRTPCTKEFNMYGYYDYYNNDNRDDRDCAGRRDGCDGCDGCRVRVTRTRVVVARAPRSAAGAARRAASGINPGDRVRVTTGFEYQAGGGPRLGYFRKEVLLAK
jgi:hypothetical protein